MQLIIFPRNFDSTNVTAVMGLLCFNLFAAVGAYGYLVQLEQTFFGECTSSPKYRIDKQIIDAVLKAPGQPIIS